MAGTYDNQMNAKKATREANQAARAARTDQQQLARLDKIFGVGLGAAKERARLLRRIEGAKNKKQEPPKVEDVKIENTNE